MSSKAAAYTKRYPHPELRAGLRSKEENMRELVRLAEVREAEAKKQIAALLDNRSNMYQSPAAPGEADADSAGMEQEIEESQRAKALAKKKFNKLRSVCIGAHQVRIEVTCLLVQKVTIGITIQ